MLEVECVDKDVLLLKPSEQIGTPKLTQALNELLTPMHLGSLALRWKFMPKPQQGNGRPVMLIPGYGTGETSMRFIKKYLTALGYDTYNWGLGKNHGNARKLLPLIDNKVKLLSEEYQQPVSLIGWSWGGFLAREIARDEPEIIRQVITLGSPVIGGPKYTILGHIEEFFGYHVQEIENEISNRFQNEIKSPIIAIYSKKDGVVAWQACIDEWSHSVLHVEMRNISHCGLVCSPEVLVRIGEHLK